MGRLVGYFSLVFLLSCGEDQKPTSLAMSLQSDLADNPMRLELYLQAAVPSSSCAKAVESLRARDETQTWLVHKSFTDYELFDFAAVRVDHVPALKKMLVIAVIVELGSERILAHACAENVEVENGALLDVHLVLTKASSTGESA